MKKSKYTGTCMTEGVKPNWVSEDFLAKELMNEIQVKDEMIMSLLKKIKQIKRLIDGRGNVIFKDDIQKILDM